MTGLVMTFKIGFSTLAYKEFSVKEALRRIKTLGFDWVEICADKVHLDPRFFSIGEASEVRSFLNELDLKICTFHAPYSDVDLASRDESKRNESLDLMAKAIDYSAELGCQIMVLHVNSSESLLFSTREDMKLNTIDSIGRIAIYAENSGIKIAMENLIDHDKSRFGSRISDLKLIIQKTKSTLFGICFDTGHSNLIKEKGFTPVEEVERATGLLYSTHIHDNDGKEDFHWPLGQGTIRWKTLFEALKKKNPEIGIIHEVVGNANPDQVTRKCLENMKHFMRSTSSCQPSCPVNPI